MKRARRSRWLLLGVGVGCLGAAIFAFVPSLDPVNGDWNGRLLSPADGQPVKLSNVAAGFSRGTLTGNDGCGPFTAEYEVKGNVLHVSDIAIVTRGCPQAERTLAVQVLAVLSGAPTIVTSEDELVLSSSSGDLTLARDK